MNEVDQKDKQLFNLLITNPSMTQAQLGEKLGVTKLTINNRIKRLKEKKVILGNSLILDLDKLGYDVTVVVNVKIKGGKLTETSEKYATDPHVCSLYTISGEYDMVLVAKFHNRNQLQNWNEKMTQDTEHIERVNTSFCFSNPKEGTNPNKIE